MCATRKMPLRLALPLATAVVAWGVVACSGTRIQAAEPPQWAVGSVGSATSSAGLSHSAFGAAYFVTQDGGQSRLSYEVKNPVGLSICTSVQQIVAWNGNGSRQGMVVALWAPEIARWGELTLAGGAFVSNYPLIPVATSAFRGSHLDPWRERSVWGNLNSWMNPLASMKAALPANCWYIWFSYWQQDLWGTRGYEAIAYWPR
jgi:hypothetical protein